MKRHTEQSWGGSQMQSFPVLFLQKQDINWLAHQCVRHPGGSPELQCPQVLLEFDHLCRIDLIIGPET